MARVHVVGAGLAGLATAVRLAEAGCDAVLYEAAGQAGGRCRSYFDRALDRIIDNGNHLMLSGNRGVFAYLGTIGAVDSLVGPDEAAFPFVDLASGEHWVVRPNRGRFPWWIAVPGRRVPGTRLSCYLAASRLARAGPDATVADCLDSSDRLWATFWDPLARAVLNTPPETGSARLLWAALRESFVLGGAGCRPLIARESLAASLIDPALAFLQRHGVPVRFGARLRALGAGDDRVEALEFGDARVDVAPGDVVVLAVPPGQAAASMPGLAVPEDSHAIVNAHFRLAAPAPLPGDSMLLGVIGGTAQWIFARGELLSLTVSAADELAERPADAIARDLWTDAARALGLQHDQLPPFRIVKEKRATFAQTPAALARRPGTRTRLANLLLAGDWTDTGLPATIEGALRSGQAAAAHAVNVNKT